MDAGGVLVPSLRRNSLPKPRDVVEVAHLPLPHSLQGEGEGGHRRQLTRTRNAPRRARNLEDICRGHLQRTSANAGGARRRPRRGTPGNREAQARPRRVRAVALHNRICEGKAYTAATARTNVRGWPSLFPGVHAGVCGSVRSSGSRRTGTRLALSWRLWGPGVRFTSARRRLST